MKRPTSDGVLLVDKPEGVTSHDVVSLARRATGERRIGHAGTLDPFATGLLVLLVGRATRLLPYVDGEPKVYEATIAFGSETDSDDRTGTATREAPLPRDEAVDAGIATLTGSIEQVPPAYSAKKIEGVRAYRAARAGRPLELAPVTVTVHRWSVVERSPSLLRAVVECSGGTYIRALARDLGRLSGSAAHLVALRRLRSGCFDVGSAVTIEVLRTGGNVLLPPLAAVPTLPRRRLDAAELGRALHGNVIPDDGEADRVALVDDDGALVGLADRQGSALHPRLVLRDA